MKDINILKYVNKHSKFVSVDKDKISEFLDTIDDWNYHYWLENENITLNEKELIIFAFLCESMNFCFWGNRKWKVNHNGIEYSGSEALFHILLKAIDSNPYFLNINYLSHMKKEEFKSIMKSNGQLPPMFTKRFKLLKETVKIISCKKERFFDELFSLNSDEELLNYIVNNFKYFDDKSKFKGKTINFNKRAILLTNDLFRLSQTIHKNIRSVNNLTGGADYALPRIFEANEILKYNDKLSRVILSGKMIRHNSQMEIEIRANTLYVLELIKEQLQKRHINVNSVELDNIIWNTRNNKNNKRPYHHTKNIYY